MAYLVAKRMPAGEPPMFARSVGRKGVTWTPDKEKARRFRSWETANNAAVRAMREGAAQAMATRE